MCVCVYVRESARAHAHVFASLWVRAMWVCAQSNHRPFLACAVQIFIKHASRCKHIVVCRCSIRIKHCSLHPNSPRVVAAHTPVARPPFKPDPSRHLRDGSGRSWIENFRRCDSTPLQMCGVVCTGCDQVKSDFLQEAPELGGVCDRKFVLEGRKRFTVGTFRPSRSLIATHRPRRTPLPDASPALGHAAFC